MIGQFTCLIFEGDYIATEELAIMNPLLVIRSPQQMSVFASVVNPLEYFSTAIPTVLMWKYGWIEGNYELFRYIVLFPLSAGFVLGIVSIFIVGISRLFTR